MLGYGRVTQPTTHKTLRTKLLHDFAMPKPGLAGMEIRNFIVFPAFYKSNRSCSSCWLVCKKAFLWTCASFSVFSSSGFWWDVSGGAWWWRSYFSGCGGPSSWDFKRFPRWYSFLLTSLFWRNLFFSLPVILWRSVLFHAGVFFLKKILFRRHFLKHILNLCGKDLSSLLSSLCFLSCMSL